MLLEDKLTQLDAAAEHLGRAYEILNRLGYIGLSNTLLELSDEISDECAQIEMTIDEEQV